MKTHREDDIIEALKRSTIYLIDGPKFVKELRAARLDRLIRENMAKQKEILERLQAHPPLRTGNGIAAYCNDQDKLTALFAENDRLSKELFG